MDTRIRPWIGSIVAGISLVAGLSAPKPAQAALLLPNVPLFVNLSTTPNIFMEMDDSGSMDWDIMAPTHFTTCRYNAAKGCNRLESSGVVYDWTGEWDDGYRIYRNFEYLLSSDDDAYDTACHNEDRDVIELCDEPRGTAYWDWRVRSTSLNVLYFSPDVQYVPWPDYPNASFTAARSYPDPATDGYLDLRNLGGFHYYHWIDDKGYGGSRPNRTDVRIGANGVVDEWDSYVKVSVSPTATYCTLYTSNPDGSGLNIQTTSLSLGDSRCVEAMGINTSPEMLAQNVANWYQYYRRRTLVARAAVSRVITDLPAFRYGFSMINEDDVFVEVPAASVNEYGAHNQALIKTYLQNEQKVYGTPLRRGLENVGRYFDGALAGTEDPIITACQKNFTVLFSDGYWNGDDPLYLSSDHDGDGGVIYSGSDSETDILLADVADYYYETDLSPLPDLVPTDQFDSANHQHMVTFTVGFGISGSLIDVDGDGWPDNLTNGPKWYTSGSSDDERVVDDLWHAAWNSRGKYISAARPEQLVSELTEAILDISDRVGGAASGATNGGSISNNSRVFQAKFDALDWHGSLLAIDVNPTTGELGTTAWEAGALLDARPDSWFLSTRDVFTSGPTGQGGRAFTWDSLAETQRNLMSTNPATGLGDSLGEKRVKYIRGSAADEGGLFRNREHKLGDIGHSDPVYVGIPPFFYALPGYKTFALNNLNRPPVIYVGANDGMLHAFKESDGSELFTYVPNRLIEKLPDLTSPFYNHQFYVDGTPIYGDIETTQGWKSILIGTLRSGAQGIFALDVTNPENFDANDVLWEFTDAHDPDMGYVFGEPQIRKLANGKWGVIFTSGYNNTEPDGSVSPQGKNYLYVVNIEDGINGWQAGDYTKIEIPNADGLSAPAAADIDGDYVADFVYFGDLDGNMWKVDITSEFSTNWHLEFSGEPLFVAKNASGDRQPITNRPSVIPHPLSIREGVLVLFGTGKYLEVNDDAVVGVPEQSVYAIWDRDGYYNKALNQRNNYNENDFSRSQLKQAAFTQDEASGFRLIHDDYANTLEWFDEDGDPNSRGWLLDLPVEGERVIRRVLLRDNIAFMVTMIPAEDVCSAGGTGWLMALDAQTGSAPRFPVFDITGDNVIDSDDVLARENPNAPQGTGPGITNPVGIEMLSIPNLPAMLYDDRAEDLGGVFPPRPNEPRGCGAEGAKSFTYTTRTNGSIEMVAAAHQPLSCGRQSWDQTH